MRISATLFKFHYGNKTSWERSDITHDRAMYIGSRTVYEGKTAQVYDPEDGYNLVFKRSKSIQVWKFVVSDRENAIYVLPEDAHIIESEEV